MGKVAGTLRIEVRPLRLRLAAPLVTARGLIDERATWLVRIVRRGPFEAGDLARAVEGAVGGLRVLHESDPLAKVEAPEMTGYGEAAPLPGHGGGDPAGVMAALEALAQALRGFAIYPPGAPTPPALESWREVARTVAPDAPAARAAFEFALCDLGAQAAHVPLAYWLAPGVVDRVDVNGVIGAGPAAAAADQARALVAGGFQTVKLKVGTGLAADVERVAAVRAAIGPEARLRLDANGAWTVEEAVGALEALTGFEIELVEQPVAAMDIAGLARVRRLTSIPVAADEALWTDAGPDAVLAAGAADLLVLKPSLLGGPLETLALARRAEMAGVGCFVTTALDGAVGRMGALHVAVALQGRDKRGSMLAHGLATGALLADDVGGTPVPIAGEMAIPPDAGLGLGEIAGPWESLAGGRVAAWA